MTKQRPPSKSRAAFRWANLRCLAVAGQWATIRLTDSTCGLAGMVSTPTLRQLSASRQVSKKSSSYYLVLKLFDVVSSASA